MRRLRVLLGLLWLLGGGSVAAKPLFAGAKWPVGDFPASVAVADLNGDAVPDLVTANRLSNHVSVLLGTGGGSFAPAVSLAVGDWPCALAVADPTAGPAAW